MSYPENRAASATPNRTKENGSSLSRRTLLKSILSAPIGLQLAAHPAWAADDPQKTRPQPGDALTFSLGDRQGQVITPQDLPVGGPPIIAYPMDVTTQTIRSGSRLNRVLVVRLRQEQLTEETRVSSVEGIVAYSAICPHTGCDVSGWKADTNQFVCPCHASTFAPNDRAKVVSGPAPRPLAMLPLQLKDGKLTVASPFSGRIGAVQQ